MTRFWKSFLAILLIFVLGGITGAFLAAKVVERGVDRLLDRGSEGVRALMVQRLSRQLNLSAAQRAEVAGIMERNGERIRVARLATMPQVKAVLEATENEIRAVLTPAQRERFDPLAAASRARTEQYSRPPEAKPSP